MRLIDLADRVGAPVVQRLVAAAFGSEDAALRATERYGAGDWTALGYEEDGAIIALIGVERLTESAARIRGIAVDRNRRRQGVGRLMVQALKLRHPGVTLYAETDRDGVRFYARCGFQVRSLGEKYPGVERFECVLPADSEG